LIGDAEHAEPRAQLLDGAQPLHLHDLRGGHSSISSRSAMSARTARALSGRVGAPAGTAALATPPRRWRKIAASWRYAGTGGRNANMPRYWSRSFSSWNDGSPFAHRRSRSANASGANAESPSR